MNLQLVATMKRPLRTNPKAEGRNPKRIQYLFWSALFCALVTLFSQTVGAATLPLSGSLGSFQQFLHAPARLALDDTGRLYITEPQAGKVVVLNASGQVVTVRENLGVPLGIGVDGTGRIYLGDETTRSVTVFDAGWNPLYKLGQGNGEFGMPNYIALLPDPGGVLVYVSDSVAHEIKVYQNGAFLRRFGGTGAPGGPLNFPTGIIVSEAGEIFVSDLNNDRITVFDRDGVYRRHFTLRPPNFPGFSSRSGRAHGIALDNQGLLHVADTFQGFVKVFDQQGTFLTTIGGFGTGVGQLRSPTGLVVDQQNRLLVASANNGRVEVFDLTSVFAAPVIVASPADQTVTEGSPASFTVVAQGNALNYRWLLNDVPLDAPNSATRALTNARFADAGDYQVIVTNVTGAATSTVARLTVLPPALTLRQNPSGDLVVSWNAAVSGYMIESATNLAGPWLLFCASPTIAVTNPTVIPKTVVGESPALFLRLRRQP